MNSAGAAINDQNMGGNESNNIVDESVLVSHLKQAMKFNIEAELYTDATFFADKVVNLVAQPSSNFNHNMGTTGMSENSKGNISETTASAIYDLGKYIFFS